MTTGQATSTNCSSSDRTQNKDFGCWRDSLCDGRSHGRSTRSSSNDGSGSIGDDDDGTIVIDNGILLYECADEDREVDNVEDWSNSRRWLTIVGRDQRARHRSGDSRSALHDSSNLSRRIPNSNGEACTNVHDRVHREESVNQNREANDLDCDENTDDLVGACRNANITFSHQGDGRDGR